MSIFQRPNYTSDITDFIAKLKADRPTLEAEQRAGRALLWDKSLSRAQQTEVQDASVAQQSYVYGTSPHENGQ
jgi:Protein of unknown function (DUF3460)